MSRSRDYIYRVIGREVLIRAEWPIAGRDRDPLFRKKKKKKKKGEKNPGDFEPNFLSTDLSASWNPLAIRRQINSFFLVRVALASLDREKVRFYTGLL